MAVAAVSAMVLLVTGAAWNTLDTLTSNLATTGALQGSDNAKDGAVDILLVGMDSRTDAQGKPLTPQEQQMLNSGDVTSTNTDTIVLIRVPNDGSSATAVSIPRDSWVQGPDGMTKINGVYGAAKDAENATLATTHAGDPAGNETKSTEAGRAALVSTVENLTGLSVDHYAEVGLLGFVLLTDAVGGVPVCLAAPTKDSYSGANFAAGEQTLNGAKALGFVRQRHGLPRGDLDRIVRQQAFMASLARKVLQAQTLANPGKVSDLSAALQRSVVIDSGWDVVGFAMQLQGLAGGAVQFQTVPVTDPNDMNDQGQSIVRVDPAAVQQFTRALLEPAATASAPAPATTATPTPTASAPAASSIRVNVLNAAGVSGLASQVSAVLSSTGYREGTVSNSSSGTRSDSVVLAPRKDDPGAARVAAELGGLPVQVDTSVTRGSVSVVLGRSYQGPGAPAASSTTGSSSTPTSSEPAVPPITADGVPCIS